MSRCAALLLLLAAAVAAPAAAVEEARRILESGGHARLQLMWEVGEQNSASPWGEWFLREIADSGAVDEATRESALTYLAQISEEPEP